MGPIDCPETSVTNYKSTLRNIPEEQISLMVTAAEAWYNASFRRFVWSNYLAFTSHLCNLLIIFYLFLSLHKEHNSNGAIVFPLCSLNLPCTSSERKDFYNICYLHWHWKMKKCTFVSPMASEPLIHILMFCWPCNFSKWPTWRTITLFYNTFISVLYMFRATSCSSSGGQIVLIQRLV